MPNLVLVQPDETAVRGEITPVVQEAQALVVDSVDSHEVGLSLIAGITRAQRKVEELFAAPKRAAHEAHRAICVAESRLLGPLMEAKVLAGRKCTAYEDEQRLIAAEATRAAEAEARQRQEDERLAEALAAEAAGDKAEAAAILAEPLNPVVVHVEPNVAHVEGVSTRKTWRAEVRDKAALVAYVAAHPEWLNLLEPNHAALNGLARSARNGLNIPGVLAVAETVRAVRT